MKARGKVILRLTGVLEVVSGLIMFALLYWIMQESDPTILKKAGFDESTFSLFNLIISYVTAAWGMFAGILGIINAAHPQRYKSCMVVGMIEILCVASTLTFGEFNLQRFIANCVILCIPVYYYYGAALNKQSFQQNA